jgi:outer membrane protein OmpA-like peptidoglycan-associated protein
MRYLKNTGNQKCKGFSFHLIRKFVILQAVLSMFLIAFSSDNPSINKDGHVGLISVYSAKSLGKTRLVVTTFADFANDNSYVRRIILKDTGAAKYDTLHPISTIFRIQPNLAFGITNFFDISLALPLYFDLVESISPQGGIGDLKLSTKLRIPGNNHRVLDAAMLTALTFPTGNKSDGYFPEHTYYYETKSNSDSLTSVPSFYSSKNVDIDIEAIVTLNASWLHLYLNSGCVFTVNPYIDNVLIIKGALEIRPSSNFALFTEITSESRFYNVAHGFNIGNDPFWIIPGISINTNGGGVLTLSGGVNLSSNKEINYYDHSGNRRFTTKIQPTWQIALQIGWSGVLHIQDSDDDLISDRDDKCPSAPEDLDGFEDQDGCPDFDNDKDNVSDSLDKCPNVPEDLDGINDDDGCPDIDNDQDGIQDTLDKCPKVAEDIDGFEDNDGCPDNDNDQDGVPDSVDKCISVPEDLDGFQDNDGCPDLDNDLDDVPDSLDKCPDLQGVKEEMGCPALKNKPKEIKMGRVILPGVAFEPKTAFLVQSAYRILDQLYESLAGYPSILLEIRAHTDATVGLGNTTVLTTKRANVIRDYLVGRGISGDRLISVGKGDSEPIADNSSIPGRQLNNRIEIFRVN